MVIGETCMNVTEKCVISAKQGFDLTDSNRFAIIDVEAGNGDIIRVNEVCGVLYGELLAAFEYPGHEEHPIVDDQNKTIVVGGEKRKTKRTICVLGK